MPRSCTNFPREAAVKQEKCSSSGRSRSRSSRRKEFSEQRRQNFAIKARKELS